MQLKPKYESPDSGETPLEIQFETLQISTTGGVHFTPSDPGT